MKRVLTAVLVVGSMVATALLYLLFTNPRPCRIDIIQHHNVHNLSVGKMVKGVCTVDTTEVSNGRVKR